MGGFALLDRGRYETRAGAGVKLLEEIEYQRIVLQNPQFVRCIYLDAAGEWHTDKEALSF